MSKSRLSLVISLAATCLYSTAFAQTAPSKAILNLKGEGSKQVFISKANDKALLYLDTIKDTTEDAIELRKVDSIFFFRPSTFHKGMEAYSAGKFQVAEGLFKNCKDQYAGLKKLSGNYSVLAGFYELECARRQGKLDQLDALLDDFRHDTLVNENHLLQMEIYSFWNAVRTKSWERLNLLAKQWEKKKLPGAKRAQIAYCQGLALEGLGQKEEAMMKFNEAIALSELQEPEVVIDSCEKIMNIILADPAVKACRSALGTKDEDKASKTFFKLLEAVSVAKLWDNLAVQTRKLPSKHQSLLKIK